MRLYAYPTRLVLVLDIQQVLAFTDDCFSYTMITTKYFLIPHLLVDILLYERICLLSHSVIYSCMDSWILTLFN